MWQVPEPSQVTAVAAQPPRCSVAHCLFPTQRQHPESPPLIFQYCVCSQRLKQLGCFADLPSCWWAERLQWQVSTGSVFWLVETLVLHTWHNGHPWEPVQCWTKQTDDAFSFIPVITVSLIVNLVISVVFIGGYICLKSIFIDTAEYIWTSNL